MDIKNLLDGEGSLLGWGFWKSVGKEWDEVDWSFGRLVVNLLDA
jgi:hypothetical protein